MQFHCSKKEVAPWPARPLPETPSPHRVSRGWGHAALWLLWVPTRPPPAKGRRQASETHPGSKDEKSQILGVPLFTQQSLLYLRLPPPPPNQPPMSGTLPKMLKPESRTTQSLVRSRKGYKRLAAFSGCPGRVQGESKLKLLRLHLQPPGPLGFWLSNHSHAEGRQAWSVPSPAPRRQESVKPTSANEFTDKSPFRAFV